MIHRFTHKQGFFGHTDERKSIDLQYVEVHEDGKVYARTFGGLLRELTRWSNAECYRYAAKGGSWIKVNVHTFEEAFACAKELGEIK